MCRERACEPPYTSNPVARTKRSGQTQVGLIRVFKVAPCLVNIIIFLFAARAGEASARGARSHRGPDISENLTPCRCVHLRETHDVLERAFAFRVFKVAPGLANMTRPPGGAGNIPWLLQFYIAYLL